MSTVTGFVQPITQPLEGLYTAFTQLASQHRNANDRLRSHKSDLLAGSGFNFQGLGANAFSSLVDSYLNTSNSHMQIFDSAVRALQTCHSDIMGASNNADGAGLHPGLTQHVLSQVTPNQIVEQGSSPIQAVISEMRSTLSDMKNSAGGVFSNLVHFHIGSAFGDLMKEGSDIKSLAGEMMSLLDQVGSVLTQWATSIFDSIKKCMSAVVSFLGDAVNFVADHWETIRTGAELLAKFSEKVEGFMKKATAVTIGVSLLVNLEDGADKTAEQFFGDLNGQILNLIPGVGEVGLGINAVGQSLNLLGGAQQNLIAGWLAKGDPALKKELSEPGKIISEDAEGINFNGVLKDLGSAAYNLNFANERGDVQLWHQLGHDKFLSSKFDKDLAHGLPGAVLGIITAGAYPIEGTTHSNRGAALGDLKKAGGDAANILVSGLETGGDIAVAAKNDYDAFRGHHEAIESNNHFLEHTWRPKIDSVKKWVSAHL